MKRMAKDFFFPTLVYYTDLENAETLNAVLKDRIYAWREADPEGTMRSNAPATGGWHSATDMHTRAEFNDLTLEIFELMQGIYDELGYDAAYEPACDSMWANINPKYGYNRHHTHPHALWSGVYYVQTPENCGLLYFSDPRPQAHVLPAYYEPARRRSESWHEVYYQPVPGRLIAFPGWLVHAVQPNLTETAGADGDRISVSFNFYQVRKGSSFRNPHRNEIVRGDLVE